MNWKEFIIELLKLISADCFISFLLYLLWKYIDLKYFSDFEIETLKRENALLKSENQKIHGASTEFWGEEDLK